MKLHTTLTGSFPPFGSDGSSDPILESIINAVREQIDANIDVLVDGQPRSDIVGIFANGVGLEGDGLPYHVTRELARPSHSVTLLDLETAARATDGRPLKAHITGPTVIAESCVLADAPQVYRGKDGFHHLTLDLAQALAEEARMISQRARELNIQYLQIDEPSLAFGADLSLAREAVGIVADAWRANGGGEVILHVCGDIANILSDLVEMPVDILNIEYVHLREASEAAITRLKESNKKIALGVIPVNTRELPTAQRVAWDLLAARERFGEEHLWGATPNCGLRLSTPEMASKRIHLLNEVAVRVRQQTELGRQP